MYLKTTSPQFLKYGTVTDKPSAYPVHVESFEGKDLGDFLIYDEKVWISLLEGIALLIIYENGEFYQFVIHRSPIINPGVAFTIVSLTQGSLVELSYQSHSDMKYDKIPIPGTQIYEPIRSHFEITNIYAYYYNVKGKDYSFSGESHYYWELTYVDTGEIEMVIDGEHHTLESQNMVLFLPGQFHRQYIKGNNASSYLTIMFDMNVEARFFQHLKNRVVVCNKELYDLAKKFIQQTTLLEQGSLLYAQDSILLTLKELMINLLQVDEEKEESNKVINLIQSQFENELLNEINNYIQKKIYEPISIVDLCNHFSVSRSTLQSLFKKYLNEPPKKYINDLKMAHAQRLILEGKHTITEVSLKLGFNSIHYFSRKFKSHYGMSPSEYLQSVYHINEGI